MSSARTLVCSSLFLGSILVFNSKTTVAQERWEDVLPQVRQRCADKWQSDYSMQAYCIKIQHDGWNDVNRDGVPTARPDLLQSTPRPNQSQAAIVPPGPADFRVQIEVIAVIERYVNLSNASPNNMVKGGLRPERGHDICSVMTVLQVRNWRGKVYSLSSNNEGRGVLKVDLGSNVYVRTMNNSFSDIGYETLITHGGLLFNNVASLRVGQDVEFDGVLFRDSLDCFKETSITVDGAMKSPEFLIRFSSVRHKSDSDFAERSPNSTTSAPVMPEASPPITAMPPAATKPWEPSSSLLLSPAFIEGKGARTAYEAWFSAIAIDEYRAGATFWASNRSNRIPPICHFTGKDFENGCLEAKRILTPMDDRRKAEPDFKQGWNNP